MDETLDQRNGQSPPGPPPAPEALRAALDPGEILLADFEADLDAQLRYTRIPVVVTDRRVLAGSGEALRAWPLDEVASFRIREKAGLGTLELVGPTRRLAFWRYTGGRSPAAHALAERLDAHRLGVEDEPPIGPDPSELAAPAPEVSTAGPLLRLAVTYGRPRLGMILLGFALTLASTAAGMIPPLLTIPLTDNVLFPYQTRHEHPELHLPAPDTNLVPWYLGALAAASILTWVLSWARTSVIAWVSERVAADLRNTTYAHLQRLSLAFFGGKRTGDLMSRIGSDTDRICNYLSIHLLDFGTDVLMFLMTAVVLGAIDLRLMAATILPFPVIAFLVNRVRHHLRHGFTLGNNAWAEMVSVLADTIPGVRVVKAFAQEGREVDRFRQANDRVLHANDRVNHIWSFFGPMITLLTQAGLLIVWAVGLYQVAHDRVTAGVLLAFLGSIGRFYTRLESMSRMVQATQRAASSAQRLFDILDRAPGVPEPAAPVRKDRFEGRIELRDVGFRYGNRPVVRDLNLDIAPGEMIGLVGASGSGKSTLVNLVCRFYDVAAGSILVDGVDIRRYGVSDYRRHIGLVLQEPFLFFGTIAENIAYGRPDATRAEILAAARAARAHEFILRLADGYDSMVGERGQSLSGGERQRISIARALLIDPRILILDEATSAVDTETEREIQEALDNLILGRTTIAIAHRLSTLRKADRLVVLERGRIVEVGNHADLLLRPGAYARLHHAQAQLAGTA